MAGTSRGGWHHCPKRAELAQWSPLLRPVLPCLPAGTHSLLGLSCQGAQQDMCPPPRALTSTHVITVSAAPRPLCSRCEHAAEHLSDYSDKFQVCSSRWVPGFELGVGGSEEPKAKCLFRDPAEWARPRDSRHKSGCVDGKGLKDRCPETPALVTPGDPCVGSGC